MSVINKRSVLDKRLHCYHIKTKLLFCFSYFLLLSIGWFNYEKQMGIQLIKRDSCNVNLSLLFSNKHVISNLIQIDKILNIFLSV